MSRGLHLFLSRRAVWILALPGLTLALWGFGGSNSKSEADIAREDSILAIKAKVASDEFIPPAAGVSRKDARRYALAKSAGEFQCGESVLKWDLVNDDYCDCEDGSDEPGTSACGEGVFECANHGHIPLRLPSSRVSDGVCDCCDGSDEADGFCKVSCGDASMAWIETLADKMVKANLGNKRREDYVKQAAEAASERVQAVADARKVLEDARQEEAEAQENLRALEAEEARQRDTKLAEAEDAVRSRFAGDMTQDKVSAMAVAVASAQDPSATLLSLSEAVLAGIPLAEALGKVASVKGSKGKNERVKNHREGSRRSSRTEDMDVEGDGGDNEDAPPSRYEEDWAYAEHYQGDFMEDLELDDMHMGDFYADYADPYLDDDFELEADDLPDEGDEGIGVDHDREELHLDVETPGVPSEDSHDELGASGVQQRHGDRDELHDADESQPPRGSKGQKVEGGTMGGLPSQQEPEPFQVPKEFEIFKYETTEAVEARKRVKNLGSTIRSKEKELKKAEDEASSYYGVDGALWPLKNKCVTHKTGGYEYRVCPFKDAYQEESKSKKTLIGKWKGIERSTGNSADSEGSDAANLLSGEVLVFDRGQRCWNGPSRTLRVALACGQEDILTNVAEPETCTYTAVLETPAACYPGLTGDLLGDSSEEEAGLEPAELVAGSSRSDGFQEL